METATAYEVGPCPGCGKEAGTAGIVHLAWCPNNSANNSVGIGDPINPPLAIDCQGMPVGWLCPKCGTSNSPFLRLCAGCLTCDVRFAEGQRDLAREAARVLYEAYRKARSITREGAVIDAKMWENFEESVQAVEPALAEIARKERELK